MNEIDNNQSISNPASVFFIFLAFLIPISFLTTFFMSSNYWLESNLFSRRENLVLLAVISFAFIFVVGYIDSYIKIVVNENTRSDIPILSCINTLLLIASLVMMLCMIIFDAISSKSQEIY